MTWLKVAFIGSPLAKEPCRVKLSDLAPVLQYGGGPFSAFLVQNVRRQVSLGQVR
jgi:hypothetical protein